MSYNPSICRTSFDQLPPFWNRRVIFLSNIFSLFFGNIPQIKALHREVGALETYSGRMVPILDILFHKKGNLIVLEKNPPAALIDYFKSIGLSLPEIILDPKNIDQRIDTFKNHSADVVTGYVTDKPLCDFATKLNKKVLGTFAGCYRGNHKGLLQNFLSENHLPTFDTIEAQNMTQIKTAAQKFKAKGYRFAVIKAPIGASGIGMLKLDLKEPLPAAIPDYLFHEGSVLVQGWLDENIPGVQFIASPSILFFVDDEHVWLYDITEQILSPQSIHEGNISPPPFLTDHPEIKQMLIDQANQVGCWLKDQEYQGTASIDFHVIRRHGQTEVRVCEINARVTGATYPSILAHHFAPDATWVLRNVRVKNPMDPTDLMETLRKNDLLFDKKKGAGTIPINLNSNNDDKIVKGQFLFLGGDQSSALAYLDKLSHALLSPGEYDRD